MQVENGRVKMPRDLTSSLFGHDVPYSKILCIIYSLVQVSFTLSE